MAGVTADPATQYLDVVWLSVAAILVFLMQAGFACLESGLVRAKNSINVVIKNLVDFLIAALSFWCVGFALMFGDSWLGLVGTSGFLFEGGATPWMATFFFFQMMFCGTATTIVSGAVAERMRFAGYFICAAILSTLIYPIVGHWCWAGLEQANPSGWLAKLGFIDFAGSTVVHSVGGWIALAAVLVIGPRAGRFDPEPKEIEGHNLPLAVLGVFLLWVGWFGFNGGSTLRINATVPVILINTVLAPVAGGLTAVVITWVLHRKPKVGIIMNGVLAGLVGITAPCHVVGPTGAVVIGAVSGVVLFVGTLMLERSRIDDAVGAVPVHLFCGVWGTLAVALIGRPEMWGNGNTRWEQFVVQMTGVAAVGVLSFGGGLALLLLINRFWPLRVSAEDERIGLNVAEHGANTALLRLLMEMDQQRRDGDFSRPVQVDAETEAGQIATLYNRVLERVRVETRRREKAVQDMRIAKEAAEEASKAKSHFLASMSHELRTPLNAVIGFSEMINQEVFGPLGHARYREYITDIHSSGTHLLTLINDLLDLSKIEARKYELDEQDVDIAVVALSAARFIQKPIHDKQLKFNTQITPNLPALRGDERVLRQILLNLLSNAVKFTPRGGAVDLKVESEPDGRIAITVSDTGIGIARKDLARVMEPFGQVPGKASPETQGTGLGLPLTRSLVRLHGGTLVLRSEVNEGTTVTIRLPLWRIVRKNRNVA
jgi:Amt family ammonium transporter